MTRDERLERIERQNAEALRLVRLARNSEGGPTLWMHLRRADDLLADSAHDIRAIRRADAKIAAAEAATPARVARELSAMPVLYDDEVVTLDDGVLQGVSP